MSSRSIIVKSERNETSGNRFPGEAHSPLAEFDYPTTAVAVFALGVDGGHGTRNMWLPQACASLSSPPLATKQLEVASAPFDPTIFPQIGKTFAIGDCVWKLRPDDIFQPLDGMGLGVLGVIPELVWEEPTLLREIEVPDPLLLIPDPSTTKGRGFDTIWLAQMEIVNDTLQVLQQMQTNTLPAEVYKSGIPSKVEIDFPTLLSLLDGESPYSFIYLPHTRGMSCYYDHTARTPVSGNLILKDYLILRNNRLQMAFRFHKANRNSLGRELMRTGVAKTKEEARSLLVHLDTWSQMLFQFAVYQEQLLETTIREQHRTKS